MYASYLCVEVFILYQNKVLPNTYKLMGTLQIRGLTNPNERIIFLYQLENININLLLR